MFRKLTLLLLLVVLSSAVTAGAQKTSREADGAAIRAHIESIFDAFIKKDAAKLRATHSEDWRGFLVNSDVPIRGIEEYMKANEGVLKNPDFGLKSYRMTDFDVQFYKDDLAVSCFNADVTYHGGYTTRLRILDIHAKRNGKWIQVASHTVIHPNAHASETAEPVAPNDDASQTRKAILEAREAIWRAYFNNDQTALKRLLPEDTLVLGGGKDAPFLKRQHILEAAQQQAAGQTKLVRLEFPHTDMQIYGDTAIIYTTYRLEFESPQKERHVQEGRATEIFVRRDGRWLNPGWHMSDWK